MFVKICGITNIDDAVVSCEAGADAIGLVMTESTRQVTKYEASDICSEIPNGILKIGVFENQSIQEIIELSRFAGFDSIQLHGYSLETAETLSVNWQVIRAMPYFSDEVKNIEQSKYMHLIDSHTPGSGKVFDWQGLKHINSEYILAGGLSPDNIQEAIETLSPWGVDVSTGVSSSARNKDHDKIKEFIRIAKVNSEL